jgi:hypothetical protein
MALGILLVVGIFIIIVSVYILRHNKINTVDLNNKYSQTQTYTESKKKLEIPNEQNEKDYHLWLSILRKRNPNIEEFELFGTKAAILWAEGAEEVEIVCLTGFNKGKPETKKYDYFSFNIKEWYWSGKMPRGCSSNIKDQLKILESKFK